MAQKPGDKSEPSLELPSLKVPALGRRGRRQAHPAPRPPAVTPAGRTRGTSTSPPPTARPSTEGGATRRQAGRSNARRRLPALAGPAAAAVTGVGVGVAGSLAVLLALAGCEAARGVSSCGGAAGFLLLVAIVVLMVLLGSALLKAFEVPGPGSTSFLSVGMVAVVALLFLLDALLNPWTALVIPVVSAASYLLAHWVTTRFDDEAPGRRDWR